MRAATVVVDVPLDDLYRSRVSGVDVMRLKGIVGLTPKTVKSMARTTMVMIQAITPMITPARLPTTPPIEHRAAMNARPHAMGCRMKVSVRPLVVAAPALLKCVPSICAMMSTGL